MASSITAASRTVLASTPLTASPGGLASGAKLTRPRGGFRRPSPQALAGIRIDPPPSLPCANGTSPPATAAAAPPLDPPAEQRRSQGVLAGPATSLSVYGPSPNSGVFVLPRLIVPAARSIVTRCASASGTCAANAREP